MRHTKNYSLNKPDLTDMVNIDDFNTNVDKIDEELKNVNNSLNKTVSDLTSELSKKMNKDVILSLANMGQDVKEAMTGGSVAVVEGKTIIEENIVDGQIKTYKTNFIEFNNLFNGIYRNDCFPEGESIKIASGDTARTAIVELEENYEYSIKTFNNDRFRVSLHNELFNGTTLSGGGLQILYNGTGTQNEIDFTNTNYRYCYIQVSNSSVDCDLYVFKKDQNLKSNIKITQENINNGYLVNYKEIQYQPYRSDYFVELNGSLNTAEGDTARTTYFELESYKNYEIKIPYGDRQRVTLTDHLYGDNGKYKLLNIENDSFKFNSKNFKYCHVYVSNSKQEPRLTILDKTLLINDEEIILPTENKIGINVKNFGAMGDGITDDTSSVLKALEEAKKNDGILYFPKGTYMMKRSIYLSSNMIITGSKGATIKKFPAITQSVTKKVAQGQNYVYVEDASKYEIGQDAEILKDLQGSARYATPLRITDIDLSTNKITFEAYYRSGATQTYELPCYFTSSFSLIRTNGTKQVTKNVLIEKISLDGNRQEDEPSEWGLSCIHIDPDNREWHNKKQSDIKIIDVEIYNSPADGISDQSSCNSYISNCIIDNAKRHGVHWGTIFNNAVFDGNIVKNCGLDAVFWCEDVSYVRCVNNYFENCYKGCDSSAGGTPWGLDSIISNNTFNNIKSYAIDISTWKGVIVSGNIIKNINTTPIYAPNSKYVNISNNILKDFKVKGKSGIYVPDSDYVTIIGNIIDNPNGIKITKDSTTNIVDIGNGE